MRGMFSVTTPMEPVSSSDPNSPPPRLRSSRLSSCRRPHIERTSLGSRSELTKFWKYGVPYLAVNAAGHEFGPSATAFLPGDIETIRIDHYFAPVIGIAVVDGNITLDQQEVRDFERYQQIRQGVLQPI